ncbi:MAG TPA: lysophospholipid acyltransferase family protein [Chitinophagaceae bacterium]|nr:lysophospholipid acyltransferase family protein [Chitinophagaceae bacterium]
MYQFVYGFLYLLSLLPMGILYLLSDLAYVIIYHLIGYRKEVVMSNLSAAFPEKSKREIKAIAKKFYGNFTDSFIETIKLFSASDEFIRKRFTGDFSVFDDLHKKGLKCQIHSGHHFNWEYANLRVALHVKQILLTVYMPITNQAFDKSFIKMRAKTGAILLPATDLRNAILPYRNEQYAIALIADQNPGNVQNSYWVSFFGRPTPFLKGPESGARRGNIPVIFSSYHKIKRGYYRIEFSLAEENPSSTEAGELTKRYVTYLEDAIRQHPDNWLWSHRRWKHEWKEGYGKVL